MRGFSTGRTARFRCVAVLALPVAWALLLAGCSREAPPRKPVTGDPLAELPVVLSRPALVIQDQTRGIGTLFNEASFSERKREAERVKAEHEATIEKLQDEIDERFAYVNAVEALKNSIEEDSAKLAPYLELVSQVTGKDPSGERLRKVAAVWVALERRASQYRRFVDDLCAGDMARKYLSLSDQVQKEADRKIRPVLTSMYSRFTSIRDNYGKESSVTRLEQHLESLDKFSETLTWVGSEYYHMEHALYKKMLMDERGTTVGSTGEPKELFSTPFEELIRDIHKAARNVRAHISVCKVYDNCMKKFDRSMENGLQANDVPSIDGLKEQLADMQPQAPNDDSKNLLVRGREEMDDRVDREVAQMRKTREQLDELCKGKPDFADSERYLGRLRKGQEDLRTMKIIFYALNLFEDAQKADDVRGHAIRLEKAFGKLREMHEAYEEMQGYRGELQQMPPYAMRSSSQQQRANQIREKVQDHKIRFSEWVSDPELEEYADQCLTLIDNLTEQVGG